MNLNIDEKAIDFIMKKLKENKKDAVVIHFSGFS